MDDLKVSLTITGSASVLAAVLAGLPSDAVVDVRGAMNNAVGIAPSPVPPMPQGDDSDDENGPVDASAPDVDANGLPWDERIHSSNHARKADGTWRARRNVDAATVAAVEAQLRAAGGVPAPVPAPMTLPNAMPMQPTAPMPVAPPAPMAAPVVQPQPVPMPMPAAAPQPMPAVAPVQQPVAAAAEQAAAGPLDFAGFMVHMGGQMTKPDANGAPLIHADYLAAIATEIGTAFGVELKTITDIQSNPQMITYAVQLMQRDGRW